ncbi:bifunctional folylpolyglutamate synthase/dihydrofolate synthase [Maribacter sp. HTCC2170]|uniref:bifunctional folylpolyglutamate synthase/dihydrofolate synthase n=1 Tax=Maribacter sp. (strain HTCC2170 / KCCM 42371) TaxID=313603 RepID=UPI00006B1AF3|nr:folylpolyglutamate synthase/dihydrofolate synthase family protein [Maribacter sp. HTCC2170]EAR00885.1 folylpolyglutamate synthase [Maribacter sp. HTCC2170]
MTYKETLDWMFAQLPVYQEKGKVAYNGKLDNILNFSVHLDNPEKKFKSLHVAGTNGKGSSSHMLASILDEAGYKVGLYTSPHLKDFRERIRINGKTIGKKQVVRFIEENEVFLKKNKLSFFEMTVGMAFHYFAEKKVDIAIVEVGLGGKLDSTNIINPEVSLITNIGMDHIDLLGDSLEKIAIEKAGIIKDNVPVVISEYQEGIGDTFKSIAKSKNASIVFADQEIRKVHKSELLGNYQSKNIKGVVAVLKELKGFKVKQEHIKRGLKKVIKNTGLLGRWQILGRKPMIVCDTAHNKEGLTLVLEQLRKQEFKELHLVLGFVKDKNLDAVLPLFPKNAQYYFCCPNIMRGLNAELLENKAKGYGLFGSAYKSVNTAFKTARKEASKKDIIFIGGSNFTVAEVL